MKKDLKEDFIKLMEDGATVSTACKKLGIHRSTFYEWQEDDVPFGMRITMARHISIARITDVAEQWMGKWVAEGDRKSVYKWLEMNHPLFIAEKNRLTMITRREREEKAESSVAKLDHEQAFTRIKAMRSMGLYKFYRTDPAIKEKYLEWLIKTDPRANHPGHEEYIREQEEWRDSQFNPIEAQAFIDLLKRCGGSGEKPDP